MVIEAHFIWWHLANKPQLHSTASTPNDFSSEEIVSLMEKSPTEKLKQDAIRGLLGEKDTGDSVLALKGQKISSIHFLTLISSKFYKKIFFLKQPKF